LALIGLVLFQKKKRASRSFAKTGFPWISSILNDSKWMCVDFMDLEVFWARKLGSL
jgi:hypothetical protein